MVLSVYSGMKLIGYGRVHIPFQPGFHKLDVRLSKPVPSSFLGYIGTFFGYQPELLQPNMLATTAGNSRESITYLLNLTRTYYAMRLEVRLQMGF